MQRDHWQGVLTATNELRSAVEVVMNELGRQHGGTRKSGKKRKLKNKKSKNKNHKKNKKFKKHTNRKKRRTKKNK
jgi:hypothetical protein